jgi:Kef-type K+ transport system membrane component KefB
MAPRGEVGIVVVTLGLGLGLLTPDLFSAVLVAVVLTTVAAPLMLNLVIPRAAAEAEPPAVPTAPIAPTAPTAGPASG